MQGSLLIDAQTGGGGSGAKGNLLMLGGGFDDGHLALGAGHLWYDAGAGLFRAKAGAPSSAGDGKAVVTGTGSASHGPLLWGNGADPDFDTGAEVCAASGLTCVTVKSTAGADSDCQKVQGPTIFYALCR